MAARALRIRAERQRFEDEAEGGDGIVLPGHRLAGLDGLPRPPAAEAVIHYGRFSQIEAFPAHPSEAAQKVAEPPVMDALPEKHSPAIFRGWRRIACAHVGSLLWHGVLVAVLLGFYVAHPEEPDQEAGETLSVIMVGNSEADQMMAGEKKADPQPEQVEAEAVKPTSEEPVEAQPTDVKPVEATQVQPQEAETRPTETVKASTPTETDEQIQPQTVETSEPQVLATTQSSETSVIQPETTAAIQSPDAEPMQAEVAETQPTEAQPVDTQQISEPPAETVTPLEKPVRQKPFEKPKDASRKPPTKTAKVQAGSNGKDRRDGKQGSADGIEEANSTQNTRGNARSDGVGAAAISGYGSKVRSCIQRSVRSSRYGKGATVTMRFTIGAGGQVLSASVAGSSGNPELDQNVLVNVRGAGPCPSIPVEIGKSSMPFTIPIVVR